MGVQVAIFRNGVLAITAAIAIGAAGSAMAAPVGGGHFAVGGGWHGGGGYGGSYHGWGGHAYYGGRGGYYGGAWHGGYYGGAWRGGYYGPWRGSWAGWGWGWSYPWVGLGWYVPVLPWGYQTLWWGGVPYYYANNYYYVYDTGAGQYEAVQPPPTSTTPAPSNSSSAPRNDAAANTQGRWTDLFAYPKGGQSTEQQARDREECHKWAVQQTGFDPTQPTQDKPAEWEAKRQSYLRAEAACLTARNYSVK